MRKNNKYNLVPYEVIERAITGDTAALLTVQERHRAYIGRLSGGNANMKERLNAKLLYSCYEVSIGVSAAAQVAKPKTAVKDKLRASRP